MYFPNDDTGNVLADMAEAGVDLSVEHNVVYFHLFENKDDAQALAAHIETQYQEYQVTLKPDEIPNVWDVDCVVKQIPSYDNIVEQEQWFEKLSAKFNGYNDGWGIEIND
ncbi:ribonuclease E inhibitor RraB [Thalassotalea agarivorans]|uniref:Regulator of ribonuclease activity B n=1 Tax=Thalassotalea agarivorans TaxID=349064 RepID=A0A1I0HU55_THASX|nr:ribonuclease E inhibitor RraB [Thalassotalea agarivorans]SET87767.1 Regulator of ribonuclease activity B [Thalassotalea agarivorans]